ncbi:MAG: RNA 2',3'-cyclic phosphodiesterase [Firmicutes bacterium]|nr:RNA 2',3'-cyclic phosphodiesterase [Bacillota bacterium]
MEQAGRVRTFVAVPLDERARQAVARWQNRLATLDPVVKWVEPANLHLTLAFLGDVAAADLGRVSEAVARGASGYGPFVLQFGEFGVFPGWRDPRVLWIGVAGGAQMLTELAASVTRELETCGFPPGGRPFRPHLTVGRFRRSPDPGNLRTATGRPPGVPPVRVEQVNLMASRLTPQGPVYTCLASTVLRENGGNGDDDGGEAKGAGGGAVPH